MTKKNNFSFDLERFEILLEEAVNKVKTEEDPDALNQMKALFKKKVPFTLRMYVAAYLAKEVAFGNSTSFPKGGRRPYGRDYSSSERMGRRDKRISEKRYMRSENSSRTEPRQPSNRVVIDEELAATLFISIGRNRRVFPRDLVGMLIQVAGLEREKIGDIRTLENYSFVQVFKEDAEKVISALDGYEYRGRKLSVSYSHKKDEGNSQIDERFDDDQELNSFSESQIQQSDIIEQPEE